MFKFRLSIFFIFLSVGFLANPAVAAEFCSVETHMATLYDAPSLKGQPVYLIKRYTPVEVVVRLGPMTKVRDSEGTLAWIEAKNLSTQRTVMVIADRAEIRREANDTAPLVFTAEKMVALERQQSTTPGWVKVRHLDGATGYVRIGSIWGES